MNDKEFYEKFSEEKLSITLTYGEWSSINMEAKGHLAYWSEENESVEKLDDKLNEYKKNLILWFESNK